MYKVIYEAQEAGLNIKSFVIYVIFLIFDIALWLWVIYDIKKGNTRDKLFIIIPTILTMVVFSLIYSDYTAPDFYDEYINGNYSMCEGVINDYESPEDRNWDRFYVNEVQFYISKNLQYGYGYNQRTRDGGRLANGIQVRIYFIPYKYENIIMKLEIIESQEKTEDG